MKTIAVIPVRGRLPLLKYTVERLYKKNGVFKVICIGSDPEEKALCEEMGAIFIEHLNEPLGRKWNAGFQAAKEFDPDFCLFVGSSDWVSDNWLPVLTSKMASENLDLVGKPDFYLLDIGTELRFCHWPGYKGARAQEPIGIGRVLSRNLLKKVDYTPMDPALHKSLDWSMYQRAIRIGAKIKMIKETEIQSLSISTNLWSNMHQFNDHYTGKLTSNRVKDFEQWLDLRFPEYKLI